MLSNSSYHQPQNNIARSEVYSFRKEMGTKPPLIRASLFNTMAEIWKVIPETNEIYQASNLGRIRSVRKTKNNHEKITILKPGFRKGYFTVHILKDNKKSYFSSVHRLVLLAFLGKSTLEADHINGIITDNRLENLRYATSRQNNHNRKFKQKASKYIGVTKSPKSKMWYAKIKQNQILYNLGSYTTEYEAHLVYQKALYEITNNLPLSNVKSKYKRK